MVIQANMSSKAIIAIWENTKKVFEKYGVPISDKLLEIEVDGEVLPSLLNDLNYTVGSSSETCIEGG